MDDEGSPIPEQRGRGAPWSFATALAATGGFLAAAGVFLPWASASGVRTTEIFGEELVGTYSSNGIADITGLVVLIVGLAIGVLEVGALLFTEEGLRRAAGMVAIVGGLAVLGACALAAIRAEAVLGDLPAELEGPLVAVETSIAAGLVVSAAGGVIAALGGLVAGRSATAT
jgi:hypothetical protein